jgi:hypothetical protein
MWREAKRGFHHPYTSFSLFMQASEQFFVIQTLGGDWGLKQGVELPGGSRGHTYTANKVILLASSIVDSI